MDMNTLSTHTMENETYNGWTNYETWNVSLWIENDYEMYKIATGWAEHGYRSLSHLLIETFGPKTPDGVKWNDDVLDIQELNEMLAELG